MVFKIEPLMTRIHIVIMEVITPMYIGGIMNCILTKTTRESQRNVPCPVYGCVACENVCKQCWANYEHKYQVLK
jgi:hypothetical protein